MRTCWRILVGTAITHLFVGEAIAQASTYDRGIAELPMRLCRCLKGEDIHALDIDILYVGTLALYISLWQMGGNLVVDKVVIGTEGEVILPCGIFCSEIEIVRLLGCKILITIDIQCADHQELRILLFECRSPETAGIATTKDEVVEIVTEAQLASDMRGVFVREIIPATSTDKFPVIIDGPVILGEEIGRILMIGTSSLKLIRQEVVTHIVTANGEDAVLAIGVVIEGANAVLHIGIVADVLIIFPVIVGLVVLVEVIHHLEVVTRGDIPFAPEATAEVAITIRNDGILLILTEEISHMSYELQVVERSPYKAVFYVPRLTAIHLAEFAVVMHIGTDGIGIDVCMLQTRNVVEASLIQSEETAIALFLMVSPAGVDIQHPRLLRLLRDDIYDATDGIGAIEGRGGTFDNLDMVDISHIETHEISILHCLTSQALTIKEDEDTLA